MVQRPTILAVGEVLWDIFPDGPRFGGAPANFACHAAALGNQVAMVSAVGFDPLGDDARQFLQQHDVDTRMLGEDKEHATGSVIVELDAAGCPRYRICENVAWDYIRWSEDLARAAATCDAICFGTLGQRAPNSRKTIERLLTGPSSARLKLLDVNLRAPFFDEELIQTSLHWANALKLNDEELPIVGRLLAVDVEAPDCLAAIRARFDYQFVALTCGASGSWLQTALDCHHVEGRPINVADTVGAGDAFTAALATGWLSSRSHTDTHRWASELATWVCTQHGGVPEVPQELRSRN